MYTLTMLFLYHYLNDTYVCNVLSYASEAWEFTRVMLLKKTHLENKETRSNHFLDLDLKIDCQKLRPFLLGENKIIWHNI